MGILANRKNKLKTSIKAEQAQRNHKKIAERIYKHFLENLKTNEFEISTSEFKKFVKMNNLNFLFSNYLPLFGWRYEDNITRMKNGKLSTFLVFTKI